MDFFLGTFVVTLAVATIAARKRIAVDIHGLIATLCATYSQHLYGMAADIKVSGIEPAKVYAFAEKFLPNSGGIGIYAGFVHIDVRADKARWNG